MLGKAGAASISEPAATARSGFHAYFGSFKEADMIGKTY